MQTLQLDKNWQQAGINGERLAISPDGRVLAAGSGPIMLRDLADGGEPVLLMGHHGGLSGLSFSRDGHLLVSSSPDKTVKLWDATRARRSDAEMRHGFDAVALSFSHDSRYLATVARENTETESGAASETHTVKLWNVASRRELAHARIGGESMSGDTAFSPDGRFLAADDWEGILRFYTVPDLQEVARCDGHNAVFSSHDSFVIYSSSNCIIRRRNPKMPDETILGRQSGEIICLGLSPDDSVVVVSTEEEGGSAIYLWDAKTGRSLGKMIGHKDRIVQFAFSPGGSTLASASWDGTLGLWDMATKTNLTFLVGHAGELWGVNFSPDGRTIASRAPDGVRLWNTATRHEITTLKLSANLQRVAFSPNGQWLAAAACNGSIELWQAPSFNAIETGAIQSSDPRY